MILEANRWLFLTLNSAFPFFELPPEIQIMTLEHFLEPFTQYKRSWFYPPGDKQRQPLLVEARQCEF